MKINAMKKFGLAGIVGGGLLAAALGIAAPAQADLAHNIWANLQNPHPAVSAPQVGGGR